MKISESTGCGMCKTCPLCWQRQNQRPGVHFTVGLLQEYLTWASGGQFYHG